MNKCFLYNNCNHKDCDKEFCLRKYKLEFLFANSLLSKENYERQDLFIDADNTDLAEFQKLSIIEQNIETFVLEGRNLYLYSHNCGNGKSSWAIRMIQSYFDNIWPSASLECHALFVSVPKFLLAIKDFKNTKNEYLDFIQENILKADIVVFDDIAAKTATEFEMSHLLSVIDNRVALGKSNIYTSNLDPTEMSVALGERLASRICNYSINIELKGSDKRTLNNKSSFDSFMDSINKNNGGNN